jgi:predicted kinase
LYAQYQNEADDIYVATFRKLLAEKKNGILERSFYAREDRAEFRDMAERAGAKVLLVYLKAEGEVGKEVLWNRICKRSEETKTADSAVDISRETFEEYWSGFEEPVGEGEIVIRVS